MHTHPALTPAQQQRLEDLLRQLKPLSTKELSYLPSYWLAREERRKVVAALVALLPEETDSFWHDVVRWCDLQPPRWWLVNKAQGDPARRALQEIRMLQALARRRPEETGWRRINGV